MPHRISKISFGIFSPEMVKQMAKVRVVVSDLYDADGYPVEGGVMDPRLGVIDPGLHCRTCEGGIGDCPGHFGYLELAKPVIHVLYTKMVYQLLRFTCRKCHRATVEGKTLFAGPTTQPLKCPHCKTKQKKITFVKPYTFYEEKEELNPTKIREWFEQINKRELNKLEFRGGRPEWLIVTLFPIPPVTMRPSITLEGGERSEDDLTHKLVDIVRINQSLKENIDIGAPEFILNDLWELVQYHVATYFDNELTGTPLARHRSGRALKGIIQRLKAKEGRIRGNLLGKRVNFSARTVISPDPRLSINEVGVPEEVATEITVPVYITDTNIKKIKKLVLTKKINYITRPDGRRLKLTPDNVKDIADNLAAGWSVDRQLVDGDVVIFNRQPSLHRISMMAHHVKVMPYKTFRLNPAVCFPYNADFDGDEMNLHASQTDEARAEAEHLMLVQNNLISPKFGGPVIGLDLDQISGVSLLTRKDVLLTKEDASQMLARAGIDAELPDKKEITGKELFSMLLPKELNIEYESNYAKSIDGSEEDKRKMDAIVIIRNGILEEGVIDKTGVGAEKGKIISKLHRVVDNEQVKDFIDQAGKLGVAFLMHRGFSIGISDIDVSAEASKKISSEVQKAIQDAYGLIDQYQKGEMAILPGLTKKSSLEARVMNVLASGVSRVSDIIAVQVKRSDILNMIESGSKGSLINTTQMAAVVGQETIMGKRIKRGYLNRTLAHIVPGDLSPASHGFVSRGFKQGLTPFELFWNIMNGREGLMDKSLRTRKSGYMQRRLVNALQDLKVGYDYTVRNSAGEIVQFKAGEDAVDPTKSFWGTVNWKEEVSK